MWRYFIVLGLLLFTSKVGTAQKILLAQKADELGNWYREKGENSAAFRWYKMSAELGNSDGQNALGLCYDKNGGENFYGFEKNNRIAFKWYKLSAEQGNYAGQYNLGNCYDKGFEGYYGVEKDNETAIYWYELATAQGDEYAKERLKVLKN